MRESLKSIPPGDWAKIWDVIKEWKEGHQTYFDIANEDEGDESGAGLRYLIDIVNRELDRYFRYRGLGKASGLPKVKGQATPRETSEREIESDKHGRALSDIFAVLVAGNEDIKKFREDVLAGQLLRPEEVPAWIKTTAEKEGATKTITFAVKGDNIGEEIVRQANELAALLEGHDFKAGKAPVGFSVKTGMDTLSYNDPASDGWLRRIAINDAGVLGRLKGLAKKYEAFWPEAGAVQFILTGKAPPVSQAGVSHKINSYGLNKIVLEVSPHLTGDRVRSLFLQEKKRSLGFKGKLAGEKRKSKTRRLKPESLDLAVLAAETPGPWPRKMDKWNHKFPALKYKHPSTFEVDCKAAFERVTGWRWEDCFDSLK